MNILEKKILDGLRYNREPFEKRLSASQADKDIFELIMDIVYTPKETKFSQLTLGSLVHKGLEGIFNDENKYFTELEMQTKLDGWDITGTADLIDDENNIIFDFKTGKYNTVKSEIEKMNNCKRTNYELQLNIYRWLYWKCYGKEIKKIIVVFMLKDGGWDYRTKTYKADYFELEYPLIDFDEIENIIKEKTDELNEYIDFDKKEFTLPDECDSQNRYGYITTKDGNKVPSKCELYCNHKDNCKLHNKYNNTIGTTKW